MSDQLAPASPTPIPVRLTCHWCDWAAGYGGPWEDPGQIKQELLQLRAALVRHVESHHPHADSTAVGRSVDRMIALLDYDPGASTPEGCAAVEADLVLLARLEAEAEEAQNTLAATVGAVAVLMDQRSRAIRRVADHLRTCTAPSTHTRP